MSLFKIKNKGNELEYFNVTLAVILFFTLYVSQETILFGTNADQRYPFISQIVYLLFAGYSIWKIAMAKNNKLGYLVSLLGLIILSAMVNSDFSGGVALQMAVLVIGYYLARKYPISAFAVTYETLFFWIALSSIIINMLYIIFPGLFSIFPMIYDYNDHPYINVFITRISLFLGGDYLRNSAFFREPGVYTIFLELALIINLFYYKRKNLIHVVVYVIAVISTLSTAGYVITIALFGSYYLSKGGSKSISYLLLFGGLLFYLYANFSNDDLYVNTFGKFDENSEKYSSTLSRFASIRVPIQIMFENPVFGVGLSDFVSEFSKLSKTIMRAELSSGGASTNTILNLAATYGVIYGGIIISLLYKSCKNLISSVNKKHAVLLFAVIFLSISNEDIRYSIFFSMLLFYGINSIHFKKVNNYNQ